MFDRFLAFLKDLPHERRDGPDRDDPRVAAAALLFHVMDADGVREAGELERLRSLFSETYDVEGAELDRILEAAERADEEAVDLYAFTSIVNRDLEHPARVELVGIMWDLVFADGMLHELEDNVVWRVAELLHVERDERISLRRRARDHARADD